MKKLFKIELYILIVLFVVSCFVRMISDSIESNVVVGFTIPETTEILTEPTTEETTIETTEPEVTELKIKIETTEETTEPVIEVTETTEPEVNVECIGKFVLTAYCPCELCCGEYAVNRPKDEEGNEIVYTATGAVAKSGYTIAVDPSTIPYGTEVIIHGHTYKAQDCGGLVNDNHIDVYFDNHQDAVNFGTQTAYVYVAN